MCIILGCLLMPLKGYGYGYGELGSSLNPFHIALSNRYFDNLNIQLKKDRQLTSPTNTDPLLLLVATCVGTVMTVIFTWWKYHHKKFVKAQKSEIVWVKEALDFYCNNAQMAPGRAFVKYQWYLTKIADFLTKYSRNQKFRNDLKSVFEMSQDDSRLTPKEKQEIVEEFASNYKFLLPEKQAVEKV